MGSASCAFRQTRADADRAADRFVNLDRDTPIDFVSGGYVALSQPWRETAENPASPLSIGRCVVAHAPDRPVAL